MHILLTNDDGIEAVGLRCLAEALSERHRVTIAAPSHEQSGVGHAFTFKAPLYYEQVRNELGCDAYAVSGTPADCVKFAISHILHERPDVVVSGLNIGENSGISSIYSGTVAGAREGALWGVRSLAFSMAGTTERFASDYAVRAVTIMEWILGLSGGDYAAQRPRVFYNVNFPACAPSECAGVRATRMSLAFFDDHYRGAGRGARGEGFMLFGEKQNLEPELEYDSRALTARWTCVTPMSLDATDMVALEGLSATVPPAVHGEGGAPRQESEA